MVSASGFHAVFSVDLKKKSYEMQLIKMVNGRKNKSQDEKPYSEKSLSAKSFDVVFDDLVEIVE